MHISMVCMSVSFISNISKVCKYLSRNAVEMFIHSLKTSRLDYANAILYGVKEKHLTHLQSAQNAAARVLTKTWNQDHITPVMKIFHWLPVKRQLLWFSFSHMALKQLWSKPHFYPSTRHVPRNLRSMNIKLFSEPLSVSTFMDLMPF